MFCLMMFSAKLSSLYIFSTVLSFLAIPILIFRELTSRESQIPIRDFVIACNQRYIHIQSTAHANICSDKDYDEEKDCGCDKCNYVENAVF